MEGCVQYLFAHGQQAICYPHFLGDARDFELGDFLLVAAHQGGIADILGLVAQQLLGDGVVVGVSGAVYPIDFLAIREIAAAVNQVTGCTEQVALGTRDDITGAVDFTGVDDT